MECVTFSYAYKVSLYLIYERPHLIAAQITQGARPKIIDLPLTLIFRIGQRPVLTWFDYKGSQYIRKGQRYTNVNILGLAIGYLNATINGNTRIPEPENCSDGSSEIRQNPRVDVYGSVFGPPRC